MSRTLCFVLLSGISLLSTTGFTPHPLGPLSKPPCLTRSFNALEIAEVELQDKLVPQQPQEDTPSRYVKFAKDNPVANNLIIATAKTAAADLMAQTVFGGKSLMNFDIQRSFLFCVFGGIYLGAFQYAYQVNVFKRLFDVDKFTKQSWGKKLRDIPGLKALGAQTILDLTVLTLVYLPAFYIFKAIVFSRSTDPLFWIKSGIASYTTNFAKDEAGLLKVWFPADLICFSVPLYLRLPIRHAVSFVWTAYLSFARGGP